MSGKTQKQGEKQKYQSESRNQFLVDAQKDWKAATEGNAAAVNRERDGPPVYQSPGSSGPSEKTNRKQENKTDIPANKDANPDSHKYPNRKPENRKPNPGNAAKGKPEALSSADRKRYVNSRNQYLEDAQTAWIQGQESEIARQQNTGDPVSFYAGTTSGSVTKPTPAQQKQHAGRPRDSGRESKRTQVPGSNKIRSSQASILEDATAKARKAKYQSERSQYLADAQKEWEEEGRKELADKAGQPSALTDFHKGVSSGKDVRKDGIKTSGIRPKGSSQKENTQKENTLKGSADFRSSVGSAYKGNIVGWKSPGGARQTQDASISFNVYNKHSHIRKRNLGKRTVRSLRRLGRDTGIYVCSSARSTHTGAGMLLFYESAGLYALSPVAKFGINTIKRKVSKEIAVGIMRSYTSDKYESIRYDINNGQLEPYMKNMFQKSYSNRVKRKLSDPKSFDDMKRLRKVMHSAIREKGLPTDRRELKARLKNGTLDHADESLVKGYLKVDQADRFIKESRAHPLKTIRSGSRKVYFSSHSVFRRMSRISDNYTAQGTMLSYDIARKTLRAGIRATSSAVKITRKRIVPAAVGTVKQASSMTQASQMLSKAPQKAKVQAKGAKGIRARTINMQVRGTSHIFSAGNRISRRFLMLSDQYAGRRKLGSKAVARSAKASAKIVGAIAKATVFTLNLAFSFFMAILGPVAAIFGVLMLIFLVLVIFFGSFSSTGSDHIASDGELAAQQYVDILDRCYENYRNSISSLYSNMSYETVSIEYRNEKNETVYEQNENAAGIVEADNNIKECLCLMSALFDFNLEVYKPEDESLSDVEQEDMDKLIGFLQNHDMEVKKYGSTYQKLIRAYLVALFNGSHQTEKRVEITYCQGCIAREDELGNISYYCPGHRHLYATVTTFYFDQLFSCDIKDSADIKGLSMVGSNNVEKIWNGMISVGYSEAAAAGVIGNLMFESGGGPNDVNPSAENSIGAIGMAQWLGEGKQALLAYLEANGASWPSNDVTLQLQFLIQQLGSGDWLWTSISQEYGEDCNISLDAFRTCTDISLATRAFCAKFERCHQWESHIDTRIQYAQNVFNTYHGKTNGSLLDTDKKKYLGNFRITYYCPCTECSEGYGNMTATGAIAQANHTIAVDPDVIPLGSRVEINGVVYTAEDVGGGIRGESIDIYVNTHAETILNGTHTSAVYLITE